MIPNYFQQFQDAMDHYVDQGIAGKTVMYPQSCYNGGALVWVVFEIE